MGSKIFLFTMVTFGGRGTDLEELPGDTDIILIFGFNTHNLPLSGRYNLVVSNTITAWVQIIKIINVSNNEAP